jgi:hypothetical protein
MKIKRTGRRRRRMSGFALLSPPSRGSRSNPQFYHLIQAISISVWEHIGNIPTEITCITGNRSDFYPSFFLNLSGEIPIKEPIPDA